MQCKKVCGNKSLLLLLLFEFCYCIPVCFFNYFAIIKLTLADITSYQLLHMNYTGAHNEKECLTPNEPV